MRLSACAMAAAVAVLAFPGVASAQRPAGRPFVSPAGQVFRPSEGGPRPMAAWFIAADTDHDGAITEAEFAADFERAFRSFDTNGDGEIDPDEVYRYETEIFPEIGSGGASFGRGMGRPTEGSAATARRFGGGGRRGRGQGGAAGAPRMIGGAARFGLLPIYHPIMEADANMNRGISRTEWAAAAHRRFQMLDPGGTGHLSAPGLVEQRMAQVPGGGRQERPGSPPPPPGQQPGD